jgi:hypothetical protein
MWYLKDMYITANYYGHTVTGKVTDSRVKLGGTVIHYVDFDQPQPVGFRGTMRNGVVVEHAWVQKVMDNIGE